VTCEDPDTRRNLRTRLKTFHAYKGEDGDGNLLVAIANKHQSFYSGLQRDPQIKVVEVDSFPSVCEEEEREEEERVRTRRVFSSGQRRQKEFESRLATRLREVSLFNLPLTDVQEYARGTTKGAFLRDFGLTHAEFNQAILSLIEKLEREFGREVHLGIYFRYACTHCGAVYCGHDAFRLYRTHILTAGHWDKK